MPDLSESRWAETTGPVIDGWHLGSASSGATSASGRVDPESDGSDHIDLAFRLAEPANAPFADRSIATTQSHVASRQGAKKREVVFPAIGASIGGFRIISELGRGAFARVYLAEQTELAGRPVALKVAEALGDEPQALARLQHTNIVPIHSVHDDICTGLRLLCMPYFGGANLAQILERGGMRLPSQATGLSILKAVDDLGGRTPTRPGLSQSGPNSVRGAMTRGIGSPTAVRSILGRYWARLPWSREPDREQSGEPGIASHVDHDQPARRFLRSHSYVQSAVWIGARLAEGLEHAHARGILHRDLKPSNILIATDGTPMLLDFNLATEISDALNEDASRAMLGGTLPYMAPEHLDAFNPRGTTSATAVDERSDIYALGLILYELIVGRHPFDDPPAGMRLIDVVARMTEERRRGAPPARKSNPMVSHSLDAILAKCLAPDPSRRYSRASDLAEDLQCFLDDRPNIHAPEPSVRERGAKWWRRHPEVRGAGPVAALGAALLIAVGTAAWSIYDHAETARTMLRWNQFHEDFAQTQLLLNTTSGPSSHLAQGIVMAEKILADYGVETDSDWTASPLVRRLPATDRHTLREEMSELMLLLARARLSEVGKGKSESVRRETVETALTLLDRAERIDPRPSAALFATRARCFTALGESSRASSERRKTERTTPVTARDFYLRGTSRAALGQADAAETDLGRAVALDPKRFWSWFVLGLCHYERGRYADAAGDFSVCTALAPDFAWPHFNRGLALARSGRPEDALASYNRALIASPNFVEALVDRALVALELNDAAGAVRDLNRALALGRRDEGILAARAEALSRLGRRDQAEHDFEAALKVRPDDVRVLIARGISRLTSDPDGARADFDRVLNRDPRQSRAHYGMALLLRRNDLRAALDHVNRAIDADPNAMDALRLRALLFGRQGNPAAVADSDRLAQTPSAQNLYNAACALALLDQATGSPIHRDRAKELLRRALALGFPAAQAASDPDLTSLGK
ncbi:MAG: protein kinase family protein [Planctomycetota bacterium]|nr:protein kinase family protein [Planctomycetota bacterium]